MRNKMVFVAVFIGVCSFFSAFNTVFGQEHTSMNDMKEQIENLENMIRIQQEQIGELKQKLDSKFAGVRNVNKKPSGLVREDINSLDKIVDEKIEKYFSNEENREKLASHGEFPIEMGYENGFFLKTRDDKFSLKTNGTLQFRYIFEDFDDEQDHSSFRIRRGRLKFSGNALYPDLKYKVQLETRSTGSKDGSKSVELLDFFGTYEKYDFAKIRFGQWKVPFNSQFMTSFAELQMIDRSEADDEFNLGRQLGVAVFGEALHEKLEYHLGLWNGNFRNETRNDNNEHLWIFRAAYNPLGHFGEHESDIDYSEKPLALIAGAVAFDSEDDKTLELREIGDVETDEIDKTQIVGELGFKYKGFFFLSEYYWRKRHVGTLHGEDIDDTNFIDQGFFAQAGYFLIPKKLEITGRYSVVDFDDEFEDDSIIESTFGVIYFFDEHRSKLQFNAVRLDEESHENEEDEINYKYLLQYQMSF